MQRYLKLFLDESRKHLQAAETLALDPANLQGRGLDALFREIHSLKGMAATMGYTGMAELAHRLEDLLDGWRTGGAEAPAGAGDSVVRVCERLADMREDIAAGGDGSREWADLFPPVAAAQAPVAAAQGQARIYFAEDCESPAARAYLTLLRYREVCPGVTSVPDEAELLQGGDVSHLDLRLPGLGAADIRKVYATLTEVRALELGAPPARAPEPAAPAPRQAEQAPTPVAAEGAGVRLPEFVEAPIPLLDEFVDILGEMTVCRSHLEAMARSVGSEILREEVDVLGKLVRQFHDRVMGLRMLPFSLISGGLRRLVREHSAKLGKQVALQVSGEEIGMDKSILLQVSDPLVHLLRNALDHALETPEERTALGKPPQGTIRLGAERARNRVEVTVADDGRGIDLEAVRQRCVARGILAAEESRSRSPEELFACLFQAGFSTRDEIGELSGRGVGLDVVKSRVEALGGSIAVRSTAGQGSEFRLSLPLSVAIVPVLMVVVGQNVLALPTSAVQKATEVAPADLQEGPDGRLLSGPEGAVPVVELGELLRLRGQPEPDRVPLVLVSGRRGATALAVDQFLGEEDLFVKPLAGPLRALRGLAGYAILGDGRLVFLLDPPTLFSA